MSTAHNTAKKGDIAKKVLMPGDPLRAKFIAKTYLEDVKCFNRVRNMLGFTGKYKGQEISIMGSGMGMPSIGIYSYELYTVYDVNTIIRVGSAGALKDDIKLMDIVIAQGACTDSNYQKNYNLPGYFAPISSYDLLERAVKVAREKGNNPIVGNVLSSDVFYGDDPKTNDVWKKMGVIAVEMESAALFMNAARLNKKALSIFTISDHLYTGEKISPEDRQMGFGKMIEIALEV